jgi:hypothetical protein
MENVKNQSGGDGLGLGREMCGGSASEVRRERRGLRESREECKKSNRL